MKTIVITLPEDSVCNEAERITEMLQSGLIDRIHIRKPGMDADMMRRIIDHIPSALHERLSLHSNPELLREYAGLGWHFSALRPEAECTGLISRSCHSPAEASRWARKCDYVTLSPVFDSISKPGYTASGFNPEEEREATMSGTVFALGGVTPAHMPQLRVRGYSGAAMLGYAWKTDIRTFLEELKCYNS